MITSSMVYWITRLDGFKAIILMGAVGVLFVIGFLVILVISEGISCKLRYKIMAVLFTLFGCMLCVADTFVPSTKEAVAIYIIPKIAANKDFRQIPPNTAKFLNLKLQGWINETLSNK